MDSEFDFEENSNYTKIKIIIIILVLLSAGVYFFYYSSKNTLRLRTVSYEVGSKISDDVSKYIKSNIESPDDYHINLNSVPVSNGIITKVGEYEYSVTYKKVTKTGKIKVIDTTAPTVRIDNLNISINDTYQADDFLTICDDYSKPCLVSFENEKDADLAGKEGKYNINIIISDSYKNKVTKSVTLTISNNDSTDDKKADLKYAYTDPIFNDFDGSMILKYDEGIEIKDEFTSDLRGELLNILETDLHTYLDPAYNSNEITDTKSIKVFNQYGYIIGYAIRVTLDNGSSFYIK